MADLDFTKSSQVVSITGSNSTGVESNMVNADSNGNLLVKDYATGPVSPGTAAPASKLIGIVYNSTPLTLTDGQQACAQADANANLKVVIQNANPVPITGTISVGSDMQSGYYPNPFSHSTGEAIPLQSDADGMLQTAASVCTDVGSFTDCFIGTSLLSVLTGTVTFTNGSDVVTGVGTLFQSQVRYGSFVKLSVDSVIYLARVEYVGSNTSLVLSSVYAGSSGSGSANLSGWQHSTANGASISVASCWISLVSGVTSGAKAYITRQVDYGPLIIKGKISLSGRSANQVSTFGFIDNESGITKQAVAIFDGAQQQYLTFRTSYTSGVGYVKNTIVRMDDITTSTAFELIIEIHNDKCSVSVNGEVLATHTEKIPYPYDVMKAYAAIENTGAATSNTFAMDDVRVSNVNRIEVTNSFIGDALNVNIVNSKHINTLGQTSWLPDPSSRPSERRELLSDIKGSLQTRGQVLTDEGSFREDFRGVNNFVAITGTAQFVNGDDLVTGIGTSFSTELENLMYFKLQSDAETHYLQIKRIDSNTSLVLASPYTGTTGSGTALKSRWLPVTGSGTINIANSLATIGSGNTNGNITSIEKRIDYGPISVTAAISVSQRIANQKIFFGLVEPKTTNPNWGTYVSFSGTDETKLDFISFSANDAANTQTTNVTLKKNTVTSSQNIYQIFATPTESSLAVNGAIVATHRIHIPYIYSHLAAKLQVSNQAAVNNTNIVCDFITVSNDNRLAIKNEYSDSPAKVQLMGRSSTTGLYQDLILDESGNLIVTSLTGFGSNFSFGNITTVALTTVAVRGTAYTEQTTGAQRSIASASANDTAAGTGVRSVKITYYTQAMAGPFTETITLNGTTGVNTTATNICFIEKMESVTVGSGGVNAGIITLYSTVNKGGVAVGTIDAGLNQTFWAHHYVADGKECNITGISCGHNGTTVGSGALFFVRAKPILTANSVDVQLTDFIRLYGQSSTFARNYSSPVKIKGPVRLVCYVTPESTSSINYRVAMDFFEP